MPDTVVIIIIDNLFNGHVHWINISVKWPPQKVRVKLCRSQSLVFSAKSRVRVSKCENKGNLWKSVSGSQKSCLVSESRKVSPWPFDTPINHLSLSTIPSLWRTSYLRVEPALDLYWLLENGLICHNCLSYCIININTLYSFVK